MAPPDFWRAGPQADLSRLPVSLDLRAVSLAEGVRAAAAVMSILALTRWAQAPVLGEAALGALLTCLCDAGGPLRRRVPALLAFAALGTALTVGFGLLRPAGLLATVPAATAAILCLSFARVWGPSAMQVGNLLVVVTVLSLDQARSAHPSPLLGGLFALGCLWSLLLTMAIWRLHPYRPARRAVAEVFRRLGAMAADLVPLLDGDPAATWEEHARAHRRHVRDGIEAARTQVLDTVRIRGGGSARANQSVIQVEAADQLFGVLIALSDVLEQADAGTRAAAAHALPALRLVLAALADETARDHPQDDPAVRATIGRLLDALAEWQGVPALAPLAAAALSRLRVALLLTTPDGLLPGQDGTRGPGRGRWRDRVVRPLLANLAWTSPVARHAIRVAAVAGPALAATLSTGEEYAHWLTITLILTLQPFFALTWQRALERGAGTVLGGVAAAGIAAVVHAPLATALVLGALIVAGFAVRAVSFGLFMAFLTPVVVLLSELGRPGQSEFVIAALRAGYTVAGGLLAVAGGALLWPSWEPARVRQGLAAAIEAHAAYADLELAALLGEDAGQAPALEAARRAAGLASNELEASLNRAMQEPGQGRSRSQGGGEERRAGKELDATLAVDAALRRVAGRLLALQHDPAQAGDDREALRAWRGWLARAFAAAAAGQALPAGRPPDSGPALARMARQLELIAGALAPGRGP